MYIDIRFLRSVVIFFSVFPPPLFPFFAKSFRGLVPARSGRCARARSTISEKINKQNDTDDDWQQQLVRRVRVFRHRSNESVNYRPPPIFLI